MAMGKSVSISHRGVVSELAPRSHRGEVSVLKTSGDFASCAVTAGLIVPVKDSAICCCSERRRSRISADTRLKIDSLPIGVYMIDTPSERGCQPY